MNENTDDDAVFDVADSLTNGRPVAWDEAEATATDDVAPVIKALRELEAINAAHRQLRERCADPATWAHLAVRSRIGEGAFGVVYRAWDSKLAKDVALKILHTEAESEDDVERLLNEARIMARLRHPNVVTVHGADCIDGRVGFWMELLSGCSLEERLQVQGPLDVREAAAIGVDVCSALAAVHQAQIVHGDVKSHNVIRERDGRIVLMDFGAGRKLGDRDAYLLATTCTPACVAPEVLDGGAPTVASDIYSVGVLLFHLVTGKYPVSGDTTSSILRRHAGGLRLRLQDVDPHLPEAFTTLVERAMAFDPAARFSTASDCRAALEGLAREKRPRVGPVAVGVLSLVVLGLLVAGFGDRVSKLVEGSRGDRPVAPGSLVVGNPVPPVLAERYTIEAAIFKEDTNGRRRLRPGDRVSPGDQLMMTVQSSVPIHVYVVNEDDHGESYLLYPLPGRASTPLVRGRVVRIPETANWQVTSSGGNEHFIVFASPTRLDDEQLLRLPAPQVGRPVSAVPVSMSQDVAPRLRGIGGLQPVPQAPAPSLPLTTRYSTPLASKAEQAEGLWVRSLTFTNPALR